MKVKALVPNLGFNKNQAGEEVELELTPEEAKSLEDSGLIELITEKKAPAKKPAPKSKPKE
ncbi:hypothetical protein [Bacillus mycoides]|uniref:hypothetical protein n=1 Tax=Bacillus mycoides TaxID=1405 RepID=UPI00027C1973|nr:hypothetical protein [Bacillus mycoides]EJV59367.1 hypothetical protein IEU_05632 [Bacillus mycoides]